MALSYGNFEAAFKQLRAAGIDEETIDEIKSEYFQQVSGLYSPDSEFADRLWRA